MAKNRRIPPMPDFSKGIPIEQLVARNQVPDDIEWDPENPMTVHQCSGHSEEHIPTCDGECETVTVDEYDVLIENERRAWARTGMNPRNYQLNHLRAEIQIKALMEIILERFEISDDEFNARFKPLMLEFMQGVRKETEAAREAAKAQSQIFIPEGPLH